ncbi:ABC transporter permease [Labrenzia sp. OB1]|uniref:ABC transporter permease n=1 Tax=Labrenzia sp. OB1 TaxID=1561204 RepID=UPI0007B21B3A|nr:ABC transporter permease [Labrenzia sp. OB1]KZM51859.1 ribose ABC transporter permease [Labrenzia sp. OB1]
MTIVQRFLSWTHGNRWIWSAIAVVIVWIILSVVTNRFSLSSVSGVVLSASFLTLISLGQMFVLSTGRGNIDLSIPAVLTLSAFVALIVIRGEDANLVAGVLAALFLGLGIGAVNAFLVVIIGIPAIIATLSSGFVLATATLLANRAIPGFAVSPTLRYIATAKIGGLPVMAIVAFATVVLAAIVLRYSVYGKQLSATGQSRDAARLAGVAVKRIEASAFFISSTLASLTGLFLGAFVGGAFLEMGQAYLLQSIAAVVVGGTLIFGGSSTAFGTMFASILLILIVTTMQIMSLPLGTQNMVQGVVVILVLALAGVERSARGKRKTPDEDGSPEVSGEMGQASQ